VTLAESSPERMTFRFRGAVWGWITLIGGAALVGSSAWGLVVRGVGRLAGIAVVDHAD